MKSNYKNLGEYIQLVDVRNKEMVTDNLLGINIDKYFIPSVANTIGTDLSKYKLISKNLFACNPMRVGRDKRLPVALYNEDYPALVSPAYFVFKVIDSTVLMPEYLMMWFRRPKFDRECWFCTDSSVRGGITWGDICRLKIPVPDIEKQKERVKAYRTITDRIELKKRINENLEQQAQAIYQSMFVTKQQDSDRIGLLSELITVKYGKDHKKLNDGIYPVYGSGGIMRFVEKPLYDKESVLIPRKGSLNNVIYINEPFWSVDTMFYTEMKQPNVAKFVFHFIKSKDLASLNAGSAVPSMTTDILNSMELRIPSADRLAVFEEVVAPLYRAIENNIHQSARLAALRDTLLPKLMNGEIDISAVRI